MRNKSDTAPGLLARGLLLSAALATALAIAMAIADVRPGGEAAGSGPTARQQTAGRVTEDQIRRMLARQGFGRIDDLKPRGPNFTARAATGDGVTARFVISGEDGAILGLRIVEQGQEMRRADAARR